MDAGGDPGQVGLLRVGAGGDHVQDVVGELADRTSSQFSHLNRYSSPKLLVNGLT